VPGIRALSPTSKELRAERGGSGRYSLGIGWADIKSEGQQLWQKSRVDPRARNPW
jgi:hypothetical protein